MVRCHLAIFAGRLQWRYDAGRQSKIKVHNKSTQVFETMIG